MSVIGYLSRRKNGTYHGTLRTLTIHAPILLVPVSKKCDRARDYRILSGRAEVGSAWIRITSSTSSAFIVLMIDTPELPRRIHATLGAASSQEGPDLYRIIWNRPGIAR
jgi:uncharacterized protein (DUF736 family)